MGEGNYQVALMVDGRYEFCNVDVRITGGDSDQNTEIVRLKLVFDGAVYTNATDSCLEYAVLELQQSMPGHIAIACCLSCRHGNFNPLGDSDGKIYCLLGCEPRDKSDVVRIMACDCVGSNTPMPPAFEVLHWCGAYKRIDGDRFYTYNDWECYLKK